VTWFVIHLRNGKDRLVQGEAARDRAMAKKSPRAASYSLAKIHQCSVCKARGPWTDDWSWYGCFADLDEGRAIMKFCSSNCRTTWSPTRPKEDDQPGGWDRQRNLQRIEAVDQRARSKRYSSQREREQAFKAHRKFEMPRHENYGVGWCRWCGLEILDRKGKNAGRRSKQRTWHHFRQGDATDCYSEFLLHTDAEAQYWFLMKRDGPGCGDCGRQDGKWVSGGLLWWHEERWSGYERIRWSITLEVDHDIPLWRIPELPPGDLELRMALFSPFNLKLRCLKCHQAKSAREAAERAAHR
jgi:hypothetical protein